MDHNEQAPSTRPDPLATRSHSVTEQTDSPITSSKTMDHDEEQATLLTHYSISASKLQGLRQKNQTRLKQIDTTTLSCCCYVYFQIIRYVGFLIPTIIAAALLSLPPSESAGGWFRYYESLLMLNVSLLTVHSVTSLTISSKEDKQLIESNKCSDLFLRRLACMDNRISSTAFTNPNKLTVELEQKRLRRIALPRLPLVLHFVVVIAGLMFGSYYPYKTSGYYLAPISILFVFVLWYLIYKLRESIVRNFSIASRKREIFVQNTVYRFGVFFLFQIGILIFYFSWWATAKPHFNQYFDQNVTKLYNCSSQIHPGVWLTRETGTRLFKKEPDEMLLSNLMKGMDLGKITQMMRPRILIIVALSSHAVILHCGLLFLYVTVVDGVGAIPMASNTPNILHHIPLSIVLQLIFLAVGTMGCVWRVFRDANIMATFLNFSYSSQIVWCKCKSCVDVLVLGPDIVDVTYHWPPIDVWSITVICISWIVVYLLMFYDFWAKAKYITGIQGILNKYRQSNVTNDPPIHSVVNEQKNTAIDNATLNEDNNNETGLSLSTVSNNTNTNVTGSFTSSSPPEHHVFISHSQMTGGDQTRLLYGELTRRGINSWYDQRKIELDITLPGMLAGIENSAVFLLFLSGKVGDCVLNRPYPRLEIEIARAAGKRFVLVKEKDNERINFDMENWRLEQNSPAHSTMIAACTELYVDFGLKGYKKRDTNQNNSNANTNANNDTTMNVENENGVRIHNTESSIADDLEFSSFMEELFKCTRIIRYDRDIGKLDVMMDDIISQIAKGIVETSSTALRWPYGVRRRDGDKHVDAHT